MEGKGDKGQIRQATRTDNNRDSAEEVELGLSLRLNAIKCRGSRPN